MVLDAAGRLEHFVQASAALCKSPAQTWKLQKGSVVEDSERLMGHRELHALGAEGISVGKKTFCNSKPQTLHL